MSAKAPTHLVPMAMWSWRMMPPPKTVENQIGEKRITNYTGVGISCCAELDVPSLVKGVEDPEMQIGIITKAAYESVVSEYKVRTPGPGARQPQQANMHTPTP